MSSISDFGREKETMWFPLLTRFGFTEMTLASTNLDKIYGIDAIGLSASQDVRYFSLRLRCGNTYPREQTNQYKREFTLRMSRPSGHNVEWQKMFEEQNEKRADYLCYGWTDPHGQIDDWVIINLNVLRYFYTKGHLRKYVSNEIKNTDALKSSFVYLDIPELVGISKKIWWMDNIVAGISDNHQILPEICKIVKNQEVVLNRIRTEYG